MSLQHEQTEQVANSGVGSSEETSKLLIETAQGNINNNNNNNVNLAKMQKAHSYSHSASNGPTTSANTATSPSSSSSTLVTQQSLNSGTSSKPVLIRQDRTSTYLTSPQLSTLGTSEETSDDDNSKTIAYQLMPSGPTNRCRTCHSHERRRSSVSPASVIYMPRSLSKESIGRLSPSSALHLQSSPIPPVYITSSPTNNSSRVIRQSSQPEASTLACCSSACTHAPQTSQTSSLRQLKDPSASDPIAGIATETLRVIN